MYTQSLSLRYWAIMAPWSQTSLLIFQCNSLLSMLIKISNGMVPSIQNTIEIFHGSTNTKYRWDIAIPWGKTVELQILTRSGLFHIKPSIYLQNNGNHDDGDRCVAESIDYVCYPGFVMIGWIDWSCSQAFYSLDICITMIQLHNHIYRHKTPSVVHFTNMD